MKENENKGLLSQLLAQLLLAPQPYQMDALDINHVYDISLEAVYWLKTAKFSLTSYIPNNLMPTSTSQPQSSGLFESWINPIMNVLSNESEKAALRLCIIACPLLHHTIANLLVFPLHHLPIASNTVVGLALQLCVRATVFCIKFEQPADQPSIEEAVRFEDIIDALIGLQDIRSKQTTPTNEAAFLVWMTATVSLSLPFSSFLFLSLSFSSFHFLCLITPPFFKLFL